ncbi:phospholipase D family protein [Archaeoglobus neptunius]|uniref:phospholipase D family protein n=1 Tax=Archaeoglobus neptunius TaxID=2798580 RepID=UPI001925FB02|nr:phospholipase D family protein [Archaeoglobus neptunius]
MAKLTDLLEIIDKKTSVVCLSYPFFDKYGISAEIEYSTVLSLHDCFQFLFEVAEKKIDICSPFIEANALLRYKDILREKIENGVRLRIVARVLDTAEDRPLGKLNSIVQHINPQNYPNLKIYQYHYTSPRGKLLSGIHAKFITVDGKFCYLGSADIKNSSLLKNLELGVLTSDKEIVKVTEMIFKELVRVSDEVG